MFGIGHTRWHGDLEQSVEGNVDDGRPRINSDPVEHIVVLVLENRSFDHMLGFLYADSGKRLAADEATVRGSDGQRGQSGCHRRIRPGPRIAPAGTEYVDFTPGADPGEGFLNTNTQLFGNAHPAAGTRATNGGFVTDFAATLTSTDAHRRNIPGTTASDVMGIFTPELLPVLSGLARGFAVCDHWFSAVPTETFPNRAFLCAATSQGHMDDATAKYTWSEHLRPDERAQPRLVDIRLQQPTTDTPRFSRHHPRLRTPTSGFFRISRRPRRRESLASYTFLEPSSGIVRQQPTPS